MSYVLCVVESLQHGIIKCWLTSFDYLYIFVQYYKILKLMIHTYCSDAGTSWADQVDLFGIK